MADSIKQCQRSSRSFKETWADYCQIFGAGNNDPNRHDLEYVSRFLELVGKATVASLNQLQAQQEEPPAKRLNTGLSAIELLPLKTKIVDVLKAYQKQSEEAKNAWVTFVASREDEFGVRGTRDPARHSVEVLLEFMNLAGL